MNSRAELFRVYLRVYNDDNGRRVWVEMWMHRQRTGLYLSEACVCVRVCLCVHLETAGSKGSLCGWKYLCHPSFLLHSLQTTPLSLTKFPLPCFTCMHSDPRSAYGIGTWKTLKNFQMKTCAPLLGSFGNTTQQISFSRVFIIPRVNCVNGSFLWNNFVMTSGTIKITDQSPFGHFVLA